MTDFTNSDASYAPGGAYDKGYQARMKGESLTGGFMPGDLAAAAFRQGWHDADMTLLREARTRNGIVEGGGCCKTFIQD